MKQGLIGRNLERLNHFFYLLVYYTECVTQPLICPGTTISAGATLNSRQRGLYVGRCRVKLSSGAIVSGFTSCDIPACHLHTVCFHMCNNAECVYLQY